MLNNTYYQFWGKYSPLRKNEKLLHQMVKSFLVCIIAGIIDVGFLYLLTTRLHIYYLISNVVSFALAVVANYLFSKKIVFWGGRHTINKEFILFITFSIIGLVLSEIIMYVLIEYFVIFYLISKLISIFLVFIWNFWSRKKFVFLR